MILNFRRNSVEYFKKVEETEIKSAMQDLKLEDVSPEIEISISFIFSSE